MHSALRSQLVSELQVATKEEPEEKNISNSLAGKTFVLTDDAYCNLQSGETYCEAEIDILKFNDDRTFEIYTGFFEDGEQIVNVNVPLAAYNSNLANGSVFFDIIDVQGSVSEGNQLVKIVIKEEVYALTEGNGNVYLMYKKGVFSVVDKATAIRNVENIVFYLICGGKTPNYTFASPSFDAELNSKGAVETHFSKRY